MCKILNQHFLISEPVLKYKAVRNQKASLVRVKSLNRFASREQHCLCVLPFRPIKHYKPYIWSRRVKAYCPSSSSTGCNLQQYCVDCSLMINFEPCLIYKLALNCRRHLRLLVLLLDFQFIWQHVSTHI